MSGVGFFEILLLCMIGLIVLGPKRLPQVANQIGTWVGQARRMTRTLKRQLEEELDVEKNLGFDPNKMHIPLDDDTFSPVHNADSDTVVTPPEPAAEKDPDEEKKDA
jgi:Tat protein translocase TatB subunit